MSERDLQNDQNLGARYQQDQFAPSPPRHYPQDQLMNMNGPVTMDYSQYKRLRRIEFAAREYLIAGGIQDDLYHETSISDAARRAASDNYGEKKEALRLALRDTSGKGE